MKQYHRLPLAATADAQRHLSHIDKFKREAFEHEIRLPAQPAHSNATQSIQHQDGPSTRLSESGRW